MTPPQIIEVELGATWYIVSARLASPFMARRTFDQIERRVRHGSAGLYRHGADGRADMLTAVSLRRDTINRIAGMLRDAEHNELPPGVVRALIARRAGVVLEHEGQTGRMLLRRPEGRGARLTPDGDMIEPTPGEG